MWYSNVRNLEAMPNFYAGDRVRGEPWFGSVAGELGAVVEVIGLELGVDIIVVFDRPVTILNHTRRRFQHSAHNFAHVEEMPMSDEEPFDSESENVEDAPPEPVLETATWTNFRVGDRVRGNDWFDNTIGGIGTVVRVVEVREVILALDIIVRLDHPVPTMIQNSAHDFVRAEQTPPINDEVAPVERMEPFSGTPHHLFEPFSGTSYRLQ